MKLHGSTHVAVPPERAFDGWAALERSPQHQQATIERVRLDDGPLGINSRFRARIAGRAAP
jgi:hypothetical protein